MSNDYYITHESNAYRVICGNAQSVEIYDSYDDALNAIDSDTRAYATTDSAEKAQELSAITWE